MARGVEQARVHWENRSDSRNEFLYDHLDVVPFECVLEIGSNCGNRLAKLAKDRPNVQCVGVDVNREAVEFGNHQFAQLGIPNVSLRTLEAAGLCDISDGAFDIVFSWATLIYVPGSDIESVLRNMIRISKNGVVMLEMHDESITTYPAVRGKLVPPGNWKRNYRLLLEAGVEHMSHIEIEHMPEKIWAPGGGYATVITAYKGRK